MVHVGVVHVCVRVRGESPSFINDYNNEYDKQNVHVCKDCLNSLVLFISVRPGPGGPAQLRLAQQR